MSTVKYLLITVIGILLNVMFLIIAAIIIFGKKICFMLKPLSSKK